MKEKLSLVEQQRRQEEQRIAMANAKQAAIESFNNDIKKNYDIIDGLSVLNNYITDVNGHSILSLKHCGRIISSKKDPVTHRSVEIGYNTKIEREMQFARVLAVFGWDLYMPKLEYIKFYSIEGPRAEVDKYTYAPHIVFNYLPRYYRRKDIENIDELNELQESVIAELKALFYIIDNSTASNLREAKRNKKEIEKSIKQYEKSFLKVAKEIKKKKLLKNQKTIKGLEFVFCSDLGSAFCCESFNDVKYRLDNKDSYPNEGYYCVSQKEFQIAADQWIKTATDCRLENFITKHNNKLTKRK